MSNTSALIASLDAELVTALASTPKRLQGRRTDSATLAAARDARRAVELATARATLDAADREEEREYQRTVGRLAALSKRVVETKREIAALDGAADGIAADRVATLTADLANLKIEQAILYGRPIDPVRDLADSGRFMRSIRWHDRQVGMLALDECDILGEALASCYLPEWADGNLVESYRGTSVSGEPVMLPTVGALYRAITRAYRDALDRFRQHTRAGLVALYSMDDLASRGIHSTDEGYQRRGYVMSEGAAFDALMTVPDVDASQSALERANRERVADAMAAHRRMEARLMGADNLGTADKVTRAAVKLLAAGETLASIAARLGVTVDTLTRSLKVTRMDTRAAAVVPFDRPGMPRGYVVKTVVAPTPSTNGPLTVRRPDARGILREVPAAEVIAAKRERRAARRERMAARA